MRQIFTFIFFLLISLNSINVKAGNVYIKIEIEGAKKAKAKFGLMPVYGEGKELRTKIKINTGEIIEINIDIDQLYYGRILSKDMYFHIKGRRFPLWLRDRTIMFYIEPNDTLIITGKLKKYSVDYTLSGNKISKQYSEYRKEYLPLMERKIKKYIEFEKYYSQKYDKDSISLKEKEFWAFNKYMWLESLKFVDKHLDYEFSPKLIIPEYISLDSLLMYKDKFSEHVLNTDIGKDFLENVKRFVNKKASQNKSKAFDFTFTNKIGQAKKLSDYKGKYVMIDFWGSWCGYCIKEIPLMKKYYEKYSNRIEFIGIVCYDSQEKMDKAIKKHSIDWQNILNSKKNDIAKQYGIIAYPTKIIIDRNGFILAIFSDVGKDFYAKLDELMKNE